MLPPLTRRDFLKQSGIIAVAGAAASGAASFLHPAMAQTAPRSAGRMRILLFHDPTFPFIDVEEIGVEELKRALLGCELRIANAGSLAEALEWQDMDLVITAHGSAFPEDAGMALLGCLARGTSWLHIGGVPLAVPVRRTEGPWIPATRRTKWHRKLGMTQAFPVACGDVEEWSAAEGYDDMKDVADDMNCSDAFALYWRLSSTRYFPNEDGSAGTRDAVLRGLLSGMRDDGVPSVAAVQLLDWLHGDYTGGRWVVYTGNSALSAASLTRLAELAGCGAVEFAASPGYARYRPGEAPAVHVRLHRPRTDGKTECTLQVLENGTVLHTATLALQWSSDLSAAEAQVQLEGLGVTGEGKSRFLEIRVHCPLPCIAGISMLTATSGFWIADDRALEEGTAIVRAGDTLTRDGAPFTVAGTTYMAGDVQRNFLLEPNPAIWRSDFAAMQAAGINMVRTGIWYGWKRVMLEPGHSDEAALRAMDAFLLTAQEHDIPVIFTFFAFLPEAWGGENPYLDPRAVSAQRAFVGTFARRYAKVPGLIWDLINEPSFCSPAQLWQCRPNYDRFENAAWREWLRSRFPATDDRALQQILIDRWRGDTSEAASLPTLDDFHDGNLFSDRQPLKVLDYRLFAQDAFASWVRALTAAIRSADRPDRLIMVGQDEGGTMDRPHPQFFADAVDITSVHSWWFNDDLLWDSVITRAPGRPHLVQETGAMFYERADGAAWRTEGEAARLIERKLAVAAGAGSAGFIQWLWNSNPYMPSDNEAAIGALRADGSAKPEFDTLRRVTRFLTKASPALTGRVPESVVLVIPHADQFSVRGHGARATRTAVRTLAYRCRVPLRAVSEYTLERDADTARLYVVPSPAVLTNAAWEILLGRAKKGAVVLVTGVLDRDDSWRPAARSAVFDVETEIRGVAQMEMLTMGRERVSFEFRGDDLQRVEKAVINGAEAALLYRTHIGKGSLLWCPLPVEMSANPDAVQTVYRSAMDAASAVPSCRVQPDTPGILAYASRYRDATLLTVISELSETVGAAITLQEPRAEVQAVLEPGTSVLLLLDRRGRVIMRSDE